MTREEAAAKANYEAVTGKPWEKATERAAKLCREDSVAIMKAADSHDAANGIHRVKPDDAAMVTRVARAIAGAGWPDDQADAYDAMPERHGYFHRAALVALAALREGSGE